jgi:SET domain-containing protein
MRSAILAAMNLASLVVRSSSIHAAGCYTTEPIRKGARVCQYSGKRLPKAVADERYADRPVTYLFTCSRNQVIDGFGTAMFLNHSCDPNCETIQDDDDGPVYIVAIRAIAAGEELVYEYNLHDSDEDDSADCYCGAAACRGTMFSDDEVKRRARLAKRKAAKRKAAGSKASGKRRTAAA